MKKTLSFLAALALVLTLSACGEKGETSEGEGRIAIITGTVSQGEEEFRAAEAMKAKYGDRVITATYPDNFAKEQETTISNVLSLVSQENVKALIFVQAVPGATAAIQQAREINPDLLVISGVSAEDPDMIAKVSDINFQPNDIGRGVTIMEKAIKMGADTFVHYSFPRHMGIINLAARRDILKQTAEANGLKFVEVDTPDPLAEGGVAATQTFIMEDVQKQVEKYGDNTAFFGTNCSMMEHLIREVAEAKAIFPEQCCASPLHAYQAALGVEIDASRNGDLDYIIEETQKKIDETGNSGRMGTVATTLNMVYIKAGTEYAIDYLDGNVKERLDMKHLQNVFDEVAGEGTTLGTYEYGASKLDNYITVIAPDLIW